ncbi:hypothetical protein QPK31_25950, partial [Massilia sp. YIM B02769]|nr:hypothetical protein [Massilia sp. YIM B02769]
DENLILGISMEDDADDGPILPRAESEPGVRLLRFDGEFSRTGRRDSEVAHLVDELIVWSDTKPTETYRTEAIGAIDAAGEALRLAVISKMTQTPEYVRAEQHAREYRAAGYPEGDDAYVPPGVASWAMAKWRASWTARQAADDILATADRWYALLDDIRALRLANKEDVRHATTASEIATIAADMEADMRALALQMNTITTTE